MLVATANRGWLSRLTREFAKKQLQKKAPKEKNYGVAFSDEKMIKLTTKEDSKVAEALKVSYG
jgi:hypothetical protein